jgi:hypothetical protein
VITQNIKANCDWYGIKLLRILIAENGAHITMTPDVLEWLGIQDKTTTNVAANGRWLIKKNYNFFIALIYAERMP